MLKPLLGRYKKLLRCAGKEIVEIQKLSEKTSKELEKPIVPLSLYIKFGNEELDRMFEEGRID
jgi:hypothetical protein